MAEREKQRRIAKRFLDDDKPCAVAKDSKKHVLPRKFEIKRVDKLSIEK